MPSAQQGSIRLFRFSGIDVFLHWSWFLLAVYEINVRKGLYSSVTWNVLECLAPFLIVLLHEFGHALACRQVGGTANRIMLWPLGGVAYVDPPQRPGATLWSIAAGPLVNVALLPVLWVLVLLGSRPSGWMATAPDAYRLLLWIQFINQRLLIFNILPVYPLDGGQILRSLLWFVMGRARSLLVATILGLFGAVGFIAYAIEEGDRWLGFVAFYLLVICWSGLQQARALLRIAKLPRRDGFACPNCKAVPPVGDLWKCGTCGQSFDTFQTQAACPLCRAQYPVTRCVDCGASHPMSEWAVAAVAPTNL